LFSGFNKEARVDAGKAANALLVGCINGRKEEKEEEEKEERRKKDRKSVV
jgi:hypothetical protein